MTTLDDWKALQRDVDAATGRDRALEAKIYCVLNPGYVTHPDLPPGMVILDQGTEAKNYRAAQLKLLHFGRKPSKPVTASLDAVLALIEREMPGQAGTILFECLRVPRTKLIDRGQPMFKWLVLDVLSAFIRARIAELEQAEAVA